MSRAGGGREGASAIGALSLTLSRISPLALVFLLWLLPRLSSPQRANHCALFLRPCGAVGWSILPSQHPALSLHPLLDPFVEYVPFERQNLPSSTRVNFSSIVAMCESLWYSVSLEFTDHEFF